MGTVDAATKQLQQRYISSRFSSVDEWPPYQPKHYTTLAFIHNKGKFTDAVRFAVAQELAVAGKIQTVQPYKLSDLSVCMTKNISDIFLPVKASDGSLVALHILIEGAPGIGKTVLAKEIAYQWAKNELLTSKKLLLLVFLRECSQAQLRSIKELVKHVFKNDEMAPHLTNYLLRTEGKDAIIVFDGFDELSVENRKESIIVDIINRRILTKSCLVITSRPTASSSLHKSVDRRVEIVGFTEEDRLDYIQTALKNCDEQVKALQHYLQSNPTINALCYIPLNMTILLCLVEDGIDTLPKTQTEMYKKFIEMTIVRFVKRYENRDLIISIADLPHPHDKLFVELSKFAYEALKTDKIVFTLSEIKESCPNLTLNSSNWNGLGLLKAVRYFSVEMGNDQVTFHFLHFSIQEYMAAWYISTLSDNGQIKLLKKTFWEYHYYNTWIMYVGITCGSSFALRHFLSGNWFQLYSKLFKNSKVCNKYLKNKMRCLHLFQCLVEANKEDSIVSVKQLFQSNRIDLSNQTLLPRDLNTLGFFLVRSLNKEWDELDLSNCNIGSEGINILCDSFLDKDVRGIVTIKMINFSYNQLKFSSLTRLFGLFNSWHTSEIFITDDAILDNATDSTAIEDVVLQSATLILVFIGSYLFSKNLKLCKIVHILSNTTNIKSMYLLNCTWKSNDSETSKLLTQLEKQKLNKIRVIGPSLDKCFIKTMASVLLHNNDPVDMLVYDTTMPDKIANEIADNISNLISRSNKDISGVMLIVSNSKVQGIVNTNTLSNAFSALELFSLSAYVRLFRTKTCSWRDNFEGKSCNKESIVYTFVEMLYIIKSDWQLKIFMIENDVLIAYKAKFKNVDKWALCTDNLSVIYLSNCDFSKPEYDVVSKSCSVLHSLNSPDCVKLLHTKLLHKQSVPYELFIYGDIEDNLMNSLIELISRYHHNISAVLAANDVIVVHNPNIQQIALAFKLQPSTTKLVLCSPVSAIVFHQVVDVLVNLPTEWINLDFTCCNIGDIECEIMHRNLTFINHSSIVRKLNISFSKLTVSGIPYLIRIVLILRVQELNINGTDDVLYDCLIKNLRIKSNEYFFLSITYSNKLFVWNTSWNEIVTKMNSLVSELYIINCNLKLLNSKEIISSLNILHSLLRLSVINGTVSETIVIEILKFFSSKVVEITISNISDDRMIRNLLTSKEYCLDIKLNLLLSTNHWLCVCNATKYQLHFIHQYFMNQTQPHCYAMSLIRKLEQINGNKMYVFENDLVNLVRLRGKVHQTTGITHVIDALSNTTSLNTIEIDNYTISNEAANHLTNVIYNNTQLQEIILNGNNLLTNSTVEIAKALCCIQTVTFGNKNITKAGPNNSTAAISTVTSKTTLEKTSSIVTTKAVGLRNVVSLTKFCISNNNISTDAAADDIATAISCNIHLQELNLGSNNLQASGIINIARSLQKISSLTKVYINNNNITDEAADDIAAAISCNIHLQELNLGSNNLQTSGIIKITNRLQTISSLTKLYINHNNITDEAADDIAAAVSCNTQLEVLDVSGNNLQAIGAIKIGKNLKHIYTPKTLFICNNNMADDVATTISGNVYLQELYVCRNNLQTAGTIVKVSQNIFTLTKLHFGNNIISDQTANDIAALVSRNTKLNVIEISGSELQTTGTIKIMKALQGIYTLKKLYLNNDNITEGAANDIAAAVSCNLYLQELNLGNNNLQASGIIKIARSLQKISSLIKLYINHNSITDEAVDNIAAAISCNSKLQEFDIGGNNLVATSAIKIMKALKGISTLRKLYLSDNNITEEAADDIATVISCDLDLQELNLGSNNLQASGIIKIAKSLGKISSLTKLYINHNNITDEAAYDIATAISCNIHLQELNLGSNNLQASGIINIARSLQKISSLTKLCINRNNITHEAADDIAAAISCNIHLQELNLSSNNLQTSGIIKIANCLQTISLLTKLYINHNNIRDEAIDDIAAAISCNSKLQEFDIGRNNLITTSAIKIMKALKGISTLRKLYLSDNNITDEVADDIAAAVSCNTLMDVLDVSGNNLQAIGATKIAKSLQHIYTPKTLFICNNNIVADDVATTISGNVCLLELYVCRNNLQTAGTIVKALQNICTLTKLHFGNNIISDQTAYDIAALVSRNTKLNVIEISGSKLQTTDIIKIMKALQGIYTLKKLYLNNDNITEEAADNIATVISCNLDLQELNLGSNNLQASGIIKIARSLQKTSSLAKLYIDHNNITEEAADNIATVISCNLDLQELNLGSNNLQASGIIKIARSLQKTSSLAKLYIDHNNITDEAADDIAAAISCNINLQELNLGSNNLQTSGTIKIARSLRKISSLTKVYINNCNITDEAVNDIAAAISCNIHLQELNLGSTNLQASGIINIARSLQKISSLTKLCINCNNITHEAADDIAAVISCNINLQELNLGSNNLQTSGIRKIANCLQIISSLTKLYINHNNIRDEAIDDIAAAISCNSKLQEFDIGRNYLITTSAIKIMKALKGISTLRKLYLSDNNITDEVADDIAAAVSCNTLMDVLDVSGNNLQAIGATKIAKSLQHIYTPKTLFICNNNIVADDVATTISGNVCLQELYVCKNNLQTAGTIVKVLQNICTLTKLHFGNNIISDQTANDIAALVSRNTKLNVIEISGSKLQTTRTIKIMKALQGIYTLKKFYLNNDNITEEAADDIATAISCNVDLQELNLGSNNLQASGIIKIARTLQKISSLTKLYINHNNITEEAADDIATVISCNVDLQELNLGSNNLQASGIIKIARTLQKISSLTKLYINHNNITEEAVDDIATVISCNVDLQELNLGSNNLQASGIIKIARTLQKISSLTKLYINHNNITEEAADDIATVISCNVNLQELNLGSNNLQASGIIKIARTLQKISSLTKLYINHNNITEEAADDIATVISCNVDLQELNLGSNNLQASGIIKIARTLQKISSLTKLYINHNNITEEAADDIAIVISCNVNLQKLNLDSNNVQASGIIEIARTLQKISSLTKLYINHNNITEEAADDIATVISCNVDLQELNLGSNNLQASGIIKIARTLQKISSLTKLYINHNNITDEAADDIAAAIYCNSKLQEFDIGGNNLLTSAIKIIKALKGISTLRKLYLSDNNITDEVADDIAAAVSCNTQLEVLDVSGNNLQVIGAIKIAKNLQHTYTPKTLFICNNIVADDVATTISGNVCLQELYVCRNNLQTAGTIVKALQNICTLTKLHFGNIIISDQTANDIAALVSRNTKLNVIEISGSIMLQTTGTIKIMKALQGIYTLKKLYLNNDNITEEAADDIATVISCNLDLQELNLGSNNLQASGIIKIARSLQRISSLTKLYINHNNITDEAADDIAAAIPCNIHLQELNLSSNNLQTSGTIKIAKSLRMITSLTKVYINNNNITDEAADDIAAAISCNIHLQELNLGSNNLQASGIINIARSLQKISSLTKVSINNNNITNEAAVDIAAAISCNIHLQELNLGCNNFQASGIINIARSLQKISSLTKLCISYSNFTDEAADNIATAISCNIHLQELNLGSNNLQASGIINIARSLQKISSLTKVYINNNNITDEAADDIAAAISCNIHLQELNLGSTNLQASGIINIARSLQKISSLTKLFIYYSNFTDEAADDIAAAISCNIHLQEFHIGGNNLLTISHKNYESFKRY